ncbi:hypothetical protein DL897_17315 [Thermoflavimicrobium daqui]|uniref:Amidase domain-containing protein n=1 Tax=Thermoflavimicrobium daqui TaxID=2137476 RepID=A0A364K0L3_9BACL|nr:hypothetical protein DL897_17315 [Thermoflavimicrobium daqui]
MSELSGFMSFTAKNGYSAVGGQELNPYQLHHMEINDPSGSSSGSAISVAADFASISVGTDTIDSVINLASKQSLIGFKPTMGILSQSGLLKLSTTFDTAGLITRNIKNVA